MKIFIFILSLLFINNIVVANTNSTKITNAEQDIYKTVIRLNQLSHSNLANTNVYQFINNEIFALFDFDYMADIIVKGVPASNYKNWLIHKIKQDVRSTIVRKLYKAHGKMFVFMGATSIGNNNIVVRLKVSRVMLDLIMHNRTGKWQVFDIVLGGQSLIGYYKKVILNKIG